MPYPTRSIMMNLRRLPPSMIALAWLAAMPACQISPQAAPRASRAELEEQLVDSRELAARYEKRYGKLLPARPTHDFRKLRAQLNGRPASAVVALLGKPAKVFTSGSSESWDYLNAAYDPVSWTHGAPDGDLVQEWSRRILQYFVLILPRRADRCLLLLPRLSLSSEDRVQIPSRHLPRFRVSA